MKDLAGPRTVPIELGLRYTDSDWSQTLMTVSEFIDHHILEVSQLTKIIISLLNIQSQDKQTGYLAQHQLFDQVQCFCDHSILIFIAASRYQS